MPAANCCRLCGATSYRPVMVRDGGVMRPSGLYRCSGCSVVFEDPRSWREAGPDYEPPDLPVPPAPVPAPARPQVRSPTSPDFSRYGLVAGRED